MTKTGKVIRKLTNENKRAAKKKFTKMAILVNDKKISRDKFYESYNSWKNHISHGNCIKLAHSMDQYIDTILNTS